MESSAIIIRKGSKNRDIVLRQQAGIFFAAAQQGLPSRYRISSDKVIYDVKPYMMDSALGFPSARMVFYYVQKIGKACPDLRKQYRKLCRELKEVSRRLHACKTEARFHHYLYKKGGLAYRSFVSERKRNSNSEFARYLFKYTMGEILTDRYGNPSRKLELARAKAEMLEVLDKIGKLELEILKALGISKNLF